MSMPAVSCSTTAACITRCCASAMSSGSSCPILTRPSSGSYQRGTLWAPITVVVYFGYCGIAVLDRGIGDYAGTLLDKTSDKTSAQGLLRGQIPAAIGPPGDLFGVHQVLQRSRQTDRRTRKPSADFLWN